MNEQREYPFEFSVVMAVYNVELFLREAVDSLINQDYGFEYIQVILVDDGSTDGSGAICDEYARQYPENVVVIHKKNGGVSSARNEGSKYVRGRYVNFMDADDKLSSNTMQLVYDFFAEHDKETDIASIPLFFFEGLKGPHMLNGKFSKGSRVIDLFKEGTVVQLSSASAFFKADIFKALQFDPDLHYTEDGKLIIELLVCGKGTLGVVNGPSYYYRKRMTGTLSAIQSSGQTGEYYLPWVNNYCRYAIRLCEEKLGYIPRFVQSMLAYDLQARYKQTAIPQGVITEEEFVAYQEGLREVLGHIDDEVIMALRYIQTEHKAYMLRQKYGKAPDVLSRPNDLIPHYNNTLLPAVSQTACSIDFFTITKEKITLEGYLKLLAGVVKSDVEVFIDVNDELFPCEITDRSTLNSYQFGDLIVFGIGFRCEIPISDDVEEYVLKIVTRCDGVQIRRKGIGFGKFLPFGNTYKYSYYFAEGRMAYQYRGMAVIVKKCGQKGRLERERKLLRELWTLNAVGTRKAVLVRIAVGIFNRFKKKKIWLICDKADRADDNGEVFFKYLQDHPPENVATYFLIGKGTHDYERLKKVGKVIPYMSWRHKFLYLVSDYVISAYTHGEINNPFGRYFAPYKDIMVNCKYICLQHGIIKNDYSNLLNRYIKNIVGLVTSSEREQRAILDTAAYGYRPNEVWLTGLPRYDLLYHAEENEIVIMPTWRRKLMGAYHAEDSRWDLMPGFQDSEYCRFYNGLLNDHRLLSKARELGYTINFVPHPVMFPYIDQFSVPEQVKLWGSDVVYRDMFARNKLLITDFSSVAFDFAYLRKPIVQMHFDEHHAEEGYFDDERDGFGEVEFDLDSAVMRIIEYMENGCALKDKYRKRIDDFFAFDDQNNCQRVYEKIKQLSDLG